MEIGLIATVITAIATTILAFATFYYAYTNRKLMLSKEKEMNRPRKKDELEQIITPIIRQCNNEIERINENRFWIFTKIKTFYNDISKNDIKKMIYEEFIFNHTSLGGIIEKH